ncbi:MAG: TVP38/TMEM64 family protein [Myxococcales bacterium]|nr:TVP38/TMEM64 family protein [Myxococcales bacterium]
MKRELGAMRRLVVAGLVVVALFAGALWLRGESGVELDPGSLRDAVARVGVWAPFVYVLVVAFRVPLGMPSQLVLVGGGLLFGTLAGTLYGSAGLVLSAVVLFLGSRWAGRESVMARLPARFQPLLDIAGSRAGVAFVAVGTGYPFGPVTMYHIAAGLTGMSLGAFALAAMVGSAVRAYTYTFLGSSLSSQEGGASGSQWTGPDWQLVAQALGVLTLAFVVPLLFRRPRSWILQALGRSTAPPEDPNGS